MACLLSSVLSIMSSMYVFLWIISAASGYFSRDTTAVFLKATVLIVADGLSPNETLSIMYVSGSLVLSISLHRNRCVC